MDEHEIMNQSRQPLSDFTKGRRPWLSLHCRKHRLLSSPCCQIDHPLLPRSHPYVWLPTPEAIAQLAEPTLRDSTIKKPQLRKNRIQKKIAWKAAVRSRNVTNKDVQWKEIRIAVEIFNDGRGWSIHPWFWISRSSIQPILIPDEIYGLKSQCPRNKADTSSLELEQLKRNRLKTRIRKTNKQTN